jgi:hypothetical protein
VRKAFAAASFIAVLFGSVTSTALAQRTTPIGAVVREKSAEASTSVTAKHDASRASSVSHSALVGAGIGAGTGLVVALIATHSSGVSDHSEDGMAYVTLISAGALIGLIAGTFVGLSRH